MERRNYKIYAVDFDGTLCENAWPDIGKPNHVLIQTLFKLRAKSGIDFSLTLVCDMVQRLRVR